MSETFKMAFGWIEIKQGQSKCINCGYEYDPATYQGETCCDNPVLSFAEPTVTEHDLPPRT